VKAIGILLAYNLMSGAYTVAKHHFMKAYGVCWGKTPHVSFTLRRL